MKPRNILLRADGSPALTDFDLVRAQDTLGATRTGPLGTVAYAAPEQNVDASRVDHRADICSLAMTAAFCVHGTQLPANAIYGREKFLAGLPCSAALRQVLQKAAATEPELRYESMAQFRDALAKAREAVDLDAKPEPQSGLELVRIPGGKFWMGSPEGVGKANERPRHEVELASFYMARTPVTNEQYERYLDAHPEADKPKFWDDSKFNQPSQPVVGVSWAEAKAYCDWAGLELPTEAQWEYACRAGRQTVYWSGDSEQDLARVGWYKGNSGHRLHPAGELAANPFGFATCTATSGSGAVMVGPDTRSQFEKEMARGVNQSRAPTASSVVGAGGPMPVSRARPIASAPAQAVASTTSAFVRSGLFPKRLC